MLMHFDLMWGYKGEIKMDAILLEFVKENMVTLCLLLGVLKVIAKETPWAADDEIIQILTGFIKK